MRRQTVVLAVLSLAAVLHSGGMAAQREPRESRPVSARELIDAFANNERAAGRRYGDRRQPQDIELQGVVAKVKRGKFGPLVLLQGDHGLQVAITMREDRDPRVRRGDTIVVRGKCKGLLERDRSIDIVNGVLDDVWQDDRE